MGCDRAATSAYQLIAAGGRWNGDHKMRFLVFILSIGNQSPAKVNGMQAEGACWRPRGARAGANLLHGGVVACLHQLLRRPPSAAVLPPPYHPALALLRVSCARTCWSAWLLAADGAEAARGGPAAAPPFPKRGRPFAASVVRARARGRAERPRARPAAAACPFVSCCFCRARRVYDPPRG